VHFPFISWSSVLYVETAMMGMLRRTSSSVWTITQGILDATQRGPAQAEEFILFMKRFHVYVGKWEAAARNTPNVIDHNALTSFFPLWKDASAAPHRPPQTYLHSTQLL
jgi:hypothetical protein